MTAYLKNVTTLKLDVTLCTGCERCIDVCPRQVFQIKANRAVILDKNRCMECGACMMNCPFKAVTVKKGVGCAAAVITGFINKTEPTCGCGGCCDSSRSGASGSNCC